jgi:virulence-associated protein VagC
MTKRVTRKLFKNGGSLAVRIPKGWLPDDAEIDIVRREDGIVELRPLDRETRMKRLLEYLSQQPELPEDEFAFPVRQPEPDRFDWDELWNGEMK